VNRVAFFSSLLELELLFSAFRLPSPTLPPCRYEPGWSGTAPFAGRGDYSRMVRFVLY